MVMNGQLKMALKSIRDFRGDVELVKEVVSILSPLLSAADAASFCRAAKAGAATLQKFNPDFNIAQTEREDDNTFLDQDDNANPSIRDLHKLAVEARIQIALPYIKDEGALQQIIVENNNKKIRELLETLSKNCPFGFSKAAIAYFNVATEDVLTEKAIERLQIETQKELLLRKLSASANLDQILSFLSAKEIGDFTSIARDLRVNKSALDKMEKATFKSLKSLKSRVALLGVEKISQDPKTYEDMKAPEGKLDDPDGLFTEITKYLNNSDTLTAKRLLGTQYLNHRAAKSTNFEEVCRWANITDTTAMQNAIERAPDDSYIKLVITEEELKNGLFRHHAASRAVQLSIATNNDVDSLKKIADTRNIFEIQNILATNDSFALQEALNQPLRDVLKIGATTKDGTAQSDTVSLIAAVAHIRHSVLTASPGNLLEIIQDDVAGYADKMIRLTQPHKDTQKAIRHFLGYAENKKQLRESALLAAVKSRLSTVSPELVEKLGLLLPYDDTVLKDALYKLFATHSADDLVPKEVTPLVSQILAHATVHAILNTPLYFDELKRHINRLDGNCPTNALPKAERNLIKALLIEKKISAFDKNKLTALTQAKTQCEWLKALDDLGITPPHDWVNEANQKSIQKAASSQLMSLLVNESAPNQDHTHLVAILNDLPVDKQQQIFAKPTLVKELTQAQNEYAITKILGSVSKEKIEQIINKNEQVLLLDNIHNAEIVKRIKQIPDVKITPQQVVAINTSIAGHTTQVSLNFNNHAALIPILQILRTAAANKNTDFNRIFEVEDNNEFKAGAVDEINIQQNHNKAIATIAYNATPPSAARKALLDFLLPLEKNVEFPANQFPANQLGALETEILAASSSQELIKKIETSTDAALIALNDSLPPTFKNLTEEKFKKLKQLFTRQHLLDDAVDTVNIKTILSAEKQKIEALQNDVLKPLQKLKKSGSAEPFVYAEADRRGNVLRTIRHELIALSKISSADFLSPVLGAKAKQNAVQLKPLFQELDKECDTLVKYLQRQKKELEDMKASLPTRPYPGGLIRSKLNEINEHRKLLDDNLKIINEQLALYMPVQKMLNPNPESSNELGQKGLLGILDDALKGDQVVRFKGTEVHVVPYSNSQLKEHLDLAWNSKTHTPTIGDKTNIATVADPSTYSFMKKVESGSFNEFSVTTKTAVGELTNTFIEQRGAKDMAVEHKDFKSRVSPDVTYTATKFQVEKEEEATPEPFKADMNMALIMAREVIANAAKTGHPVVINGTNAYHVKMLWTAVMVLKDIGPGKALSDKDIKVASHYFNPKTQYSRWGGYDKTISFYHQFKSSDFYAGIKQEVQELQQAKVVASENEASVKASVIELTRRFKEDKNGIKKAVDTMEKENRDDEQYKPPTP